jgi:hypothetical protein
MVLVQVVHSIQAVTATVPFGMIMLLDHIKRKTIPPELRIRMVYLNPTFLELHVCYWETSNNLYSVCWYYEKARANTADLLLAASDPAPRVLQIFPTNGILSCSYWDVPEPDALKVWLDEFIGDDCVNTISEVRDCHLIYILHSRCRLSFRAELSPVASAGARRLRLGNFSAFEHSPWCGGRQSFDCCGCE